MSFKLNTSDTTTIDFSQQVSYLELIINNCFMYALFFLHSVNYQKQKHPNIKCSILILLISVYQ